MGRRNQANSPTAVAPAAERGMLSPRRLNLLAAAAIAVAAIWVYSNSFSGPFVFDDGTWIEGNKSIRQLWPIWPVLAPQNAGVIGGRPVLSLTLALNYALGELNVWGYHAVNLLIHILAAWTLFGLIRRTLLLPSPPRSPPQDYFPLSAANDGEEPRFASVATPLAFAATLIWTVHPLQTAAVTYIIQRTESLVALFYLLTLYCVLRGATSLGAGRRWYVVAAVAACVCGMATKEVMATAPLVVLLYDRTFLSGSFAAALRRRWGLYLALAASWGVIVWVLLATGFHGGTTGFAVGRFTWWSYFLTQPGVLVHYLQLAFWPAGLCLDYRWPAAHGIGQIVPAGLLVVSLLGLTVWALLKHPALGFLGASFFLILAPTSSLVPINDAAFDHRMYLPLAALVVLVVVGGKLLCDHYLVERGTARRRAEPESTPSQTFVPIAALTVVVVALGWATVVRNRDYRSKIAIWSDAMQKRPLNARAPYSLALALNEAGKTEAAVAAYEAALKVDPDSTDAMVNLGVAFLQLKRPDLAIVHLRRALELDPKELNALNAIATILADEGKFAEAVDRLKLAQAIDPNFVGACITLGNVLEKQGKLPEAIAQYERGVEIDPDSPNTRNNLGITLVKIGQFDRAIAQYRAVLASDPHNVGTRFNLAVALTRNQKTPEAIAQFREAIQSSPGLTPQLSAFAWDLATSPKASERDGPAAVALGQLAMELSGGSDIAANDALGAAYADVGRFNRAADFERQALRLAEIQKRDNLIAGLRMRIELYTSGEPYRVPPPQKPAP